MFGPFDGRRHDSTMFKVSNLLDLLRTNLPCWCIFADGAYPLSPQVIKPFMGAAATPNQHAWNASMSRVRISVEWGYHLVTRLWGMVNFVPQQQTLKTQSAKNYMVAAILTNLQNCCQPNQISQYFEVQLPTLEQYCGLEDL